LIFLDIDLALLYFRNLKYVLLCYHPSIFASLPLFPPFSDPPSLPPSVCCLCRQPCPLSNGQALPSLHCSTRQLRQCYTIPPPLHKILVSLIHRKKKKKPCSSTVEVRNNLTIRGSKKDTVFQQSVCTRVCVFYIYEIL
jgi:hypothetical protein